MPDSRPFADIDLNNLEKEWVDHVSKVRDFTERAANAKHKLAEAKAAFELTEAVLLRDIRNAPDKFNLPVKPTEGAIKNCVLYQKKYKDAERAYLAAKHEDDLLDAAVKTLDHRKRALENLVSLWSQGYFGAPREQRKQGVPRTRVGGRPKDPDEKLVPDDDIPF